MIINLNKMAPDEIQIVRKCMHAALMEKFFPEWEFSTLFGIERSELLETMNRFPNVDLRNYIDKAAVRGSLAHLTFYPHGLDDELKSITSADSKEILGILKKLDKIIDAELR